MPKYYLSIGFQAECFSLCVLQAPKITVTERRGKSVVCAFGNNMYVISTSWLMN